MTINKLILISFISFCLAACISESDVSAGGQKQISTDHKSYSQTIVEQSENNVSSAYSLSKQKYVCPMHSHIISDHEGSCPICGMNLVAKKVEKKIVVNHHNEHGQRQYEPVEINTSNLQKLAIKTEIVTLGKLSHEIETLGKITRIDPMAKTRITPPINGKLSYVVDKYSGDTVKQDEHLFSVISDELFSLQKALKKAYGSGDKTRANGLVDKLSAMGIDAEQIAKLQQGAAANLPIKIYALENGFIFAKRGRVGQNITDSFTVFNLGGNYQVIEVTAEIFERQWDLVKEGQSATMQMRNLPGETFSGIVERVDEPVGYTTRALEVRIKFKTDRTDLSQSTFARVIIKGKTRHQLITLARDAVIRTADGDRVVKVLKDGYFQPVAVVVGEESNGRIEIRSGIKVGDKVVSSGQFIIDSESNIQSALKRMMTDNKDF